MFDFFDYSDYSIHSGYVNYGMGILTTIMLYNMKPVYNYLKTKGSSSICKACSQYVEITEMRLNGINPSNKTGLTPQQSKNAHYQKRYTKVPSTIKGGLTSRQSKNAVPRMVY